MAGLNKRVTDLTALTTPIATDVLPIVDVTDFTQDPTGSLKQITYTNLSAPILTSAASAAATATSAALVTERTTAATLTNKTITSPSITTPTITTPTINMGSDAAGDIAYRASGGTLARLALGGNGQYLGSNGTIPTWGTPSAPSGSISMYAGLSAPTNWLLCDGSAVSRTTYANLFTAISTAYGVGDGSTTFNVPNFKGKVPVGYDVAQTEFNALAKTGGEKTHVLLTAEMPSHTHTVPYDSGGSGNNVLATQTNGALGAKTSSSTGGDGAHNNLQPYLTVSFIIAI